VWALTGEVVLLALGVGGVGGDGLGVLHPDGGGDGDEARDEGEGLLLLAHG